LGQSFTTRQREPATNSATAIENPCHPGSSSGWMLMGTAEFKQSKSLPEVLSWPPKLQPWNSRHVGC